VGYISLTSHYLGLVQVAGVVYDLDFACQEVDRLTGQVKMLQSVSEAYTAAERSADDVYHIALQDMSTQLQTAASDRAACQTAIIKLQEYGAPACRCVSVRDCADVHV
jgi:hypothetical protein